MATPRFAIRQIKITNSPPKIIQQHPVNPQILEILIQTNKNHQLPTKNHPITSCKSSNPGNPDMATPRFAIRQIKIPNSPPKIIQ
ncbi:hypothetical protein [Dolichospermum flos-aquae]|uniref:Uncharacterized protein n=1 Tax=Dolichospermum flos-aquae UHCC 0037 TaxID=2590026 RepID=A0ACC7SAT3_DOLFA|nr:hypothetical protein [Dolichospermum flos-aquae]MTJ45464.1 hypothetical protein [Dolichospermum flos-aquae UHCC 0037]